MAVINLTTTIIFDSLHQIVPNNDNGNASDAEVMENA